MNLLKFCSLIFLFTVFSVTSFACRCRNLPIKKQFRESQIVLIGQPIELMDSREDKMKYDLAEGESFKAKIKVSRKFKGDIEDNLFLKLDSKHTDCDVYFKKGEEYLLFIYKENYKYYVKACTSSRLLKDSSKEIRALEKIRRG